MKFKRDRYSFNHPKAKAPLVLKAFSEEGAWKKFRKFIISMMFDAWSLSYDQDKVNSVLNQTTCNKL